MLRFGVGCKFTDASKRYDKVTGGFTDEFVYPQTKVFQAARIESHMGDTTILDTEGHWHYNIFACTVVEEAPAGYAARMELDVALDGLVRRYGVDAVREALGRRCPL